MDFFYSARYFCRISMHEYDNPIDYIDEMTLQNLKLGLYS